MNDPFATLIRARREELGISRAEVARKVDRTESWMSLIETSRRQPDIDVIPSLAQAIGKDARDLTQFYIHRYHPSVARALFDSPSPAVQDREPDKAERDLAFMISRLPARVRQAIESLVHELAS